MNLVTGVLVLLPVIAISVKTAHFFLGIPNSVTGGGSGESVSQRVSKSASQRVSESASQRVSESASQRVSESVSQ